MSIDDAIDLCLMLGVQKYDICWEIGFGYPNLLFTLAAFTETLVVGNMFLISLVL